MLLVLVLSVMLFLQGTVDSFFLGYNPLFICWLRLHRYGKVYYTVPFSLQSSGSLVSTAPSGAPASLTLGTLTAKSATLQWGEVPWSPQLPVVHLPHSHWVPSLLKVPLYSGERCPGLHSSQWCTCLTHTGYPHC